ncbi:MAG: hypothetical protein A3F68_05995 [Acidobacteria bacterium RIFCSPLOWO2_12_FULL_54_10]|nr:MAG: hypothetical protein A3F68_05995 [Acidobacteria bacterium RIFCSPLOWO2_12_FULL_54_10]
MFETSQQESSSGDTKLIGGVIVAIMVVIGVLYYFFIHTAPVAGTDSAAAATAGIVEEPSPLQDIRIVSFNLGKDQTQTMAMWSIQLANRTSTITYKNIQFATNYYDDAGTLIYQNTGTLLQELGPGDQQTFSDINDGLYPVGTTRYTIEIKEAEAVKPQ